MRILFYGLNFTPELVGIGKYTGEMVRWLAARGHQVKIICAPPYYPDWRIGAGYSARAYHRETIDGAEVLRCPLWIPKKITGISRILHLFSFAFSSFIPMLWQRRWRPDVVFAIEPPLFGSVTALLSARLSGAHAWLHVQDFEIDAAFDLGLIKSEPLHRLSSAIERALMRRFDRVSSISEKMVQRALVKTAGDTSCLLFPNWVDIGKIFPLQRPSSYRAALGIPEDGIVLLYSGSMGEKHGLELILKAACELEHNSRYRFVMAGSGSIYEQLRYTARDLSNTLWLPLQPEESLNEFLNLADIHLLPQKEQAADLVMPSKLTGMLSSGRPVISTARSGTQIADIVEQTGLVVEPGSLQAVIAAIIRLGDDHGMRKTLGAAARDYATELFEQDKVLANLERDLLALLIPEPEPFQNALSPMQPESQEGSTKQVTGLLSILASLLRGEMPADLDTLDEATTDRLLHLCTVHGIEPLVYAALEREPARRPSIDSLRHQLKPKVQAQAAAELVKKLSILRLLQAFAEADIPVAVLKGVALGYTLYPEPYYRTRGDLDLIISEQDRKAADTLLLNEGYRRMDALREAGSFQISYSKPQHRQPTEPLDLHWKLNDHRLFADILPPERLLQAGQPAPRLSRHARIPCNVHALLHACIHRAANFTTHYQVAGEAIINPDRLIWLYDIHLLAQAFTTADWEQFCDLAETHRLRAICRDALLAAHRYLNTPIQSSAMHRLSEPGPTEPSAAYLRPGLTHKLLTDVRAQPNWRARVKLAASYALPPEEFMRRKYGRGNWPLPALYLLHLGRGIRKLLST